MTPPPLRPRPLGARDSAAEAAAAAAAAAEAERARRLLDRHLPAPDYQPLSLRLRWMLAVAGVATACAVAFVLAARPGQPGIDRRLLPDDQARCAPGQTQNCVGGQVQVIVPVFAVPASAPGR
jgi:hypothetical protein